jgi:hypothetical protein
VFLWKRCGRTEAENSLKKYLFPVPLRLHPRSMGKKARREQKNGVQTKK